MSQVLDPRQSLILKIQGKSGSSVLFLKLKDLYPECEVLIQGLPECFPLHCLERDSCPRNQNCMEKLVKRIQFVFETFADARTVILYFKYQDRPGSHRAGVFWRDMREPRLITFNRSAWEKCKTIGTVYQYRLPDSLFLATVGEPDRLYSLRTF